MEQGRLALIVRGVSHIDYTLLGKRSLQSLLGGVGPFLPGRADMPFHSLVGHTFLLADDVHRPRQPAEAYEHRLRGGMYGRQESGTAYPHGRGGIAPPPPAATEGSAFPGGCSQYG